MTDYDDLPFKVERWTKGYAEPEETIAMCADLLSARAALDVAVKRRSGEPLLLRHKARVIAEDRNSGARASASAGTQPLAGEPYERNR